MAASCEVESFSIVSSETLDSLICSSCGNYATVSPILIQNENIICGRCKADESVQSFPLNTEDFKNKLFRCVHRFTGCKELLKPSEILTHEKICVKKEVLYCREKSCNFFGNGCQIYQHYKKKHTNMCLDYPFFNICNSNYTKFKNYFYCLKDWLFVIQVTFVQTNNINIKIFNFGDDYYNPVKYDVCLKTAKFERSYCNSTGNTCFYKKGPFQQDVKICLDDLKTMLEKPYNKTPTLCCFITFKTNNAGCEFFKNVPIKSQNKDPQELQTISTQTETYEPTENVGVQTENDEHNIVIRSTYFRNRFRPRRGSTTRAAEISQRREQILHFPSQQLDIQTESNINNRAVNISTQTLERFCEVNASSTQTSKKIQCVQIKDLDALHNENSNLKTMVECVQNNLWNSFKCTHCEAYCLSKICVCANKHIKCEECLGDYCKLCMDITNHFEAKDLQQLSKVVPLPCRWNCHKIFTASELRKHEAFCVKRVYKCPVVYCQFKGSLSEIVEHWHDELPLLHTTTYCKVPLKGTDFYKCYLINCGEIFYCCFGPYRRNGRNVHVRKVSPNSYSDVTLLVDVILKKMDSANEKLYIRQINEHSILKCNDFIQVCLFNDPGEYYEVQVNIYRK